MKRLWAWLTLGDYEEAKRAASLSPGLILEDDLRRMAIAAGRAMERLLKMRGKS